MLRDGHFGEVNSQPPEQGWRQDVWQPYPVDSERPTQHWDTDRLFSSSWAVEGTCAGESGVRVDSARPSSLTSSNKQDVCLLAAWAIEELQAPVMACFATNFAEEMGVTSGHWDQAPALPLSSRCLGWELNTVRLFSSVKRIPSPHPPETTTKVWGGLRGRPGKSTQER